MSNLVTTGKPKVTGAVFKAPKGTTLPTDAKTALSATFKGLGYVTEDGVSLDNNYSSDVIKAWGGDAVLTNNTDKGYAFSLSFMEHLNDEVLKLPYGDANITTKTGSSGASDTIEVTATGEVGSDAVYVIEMVTKEGKADRIIIPEGSITAVGSVTYKDDSAIVYPITITPLAYKIGDKLVYFKEYIEK